MYSLENVTSRPDGLVELETFELVKHPFSVALHRFEWAFGLDQLRFPFHGEENKLTVHKQLVHYVRDQKLSFFPSVSVVEKAIRMIEHNKKARSAEDRQRFEDFGTGPWEYVLFSTKGGETLPSLFYRLPDGSTTPLSLDSLTYEDLPRFMSNINPLVVIFYRKLYSISPSRVDQSLAKHVVTPMEAMLRKWPLWAHNRFLPQLTSPKRKRPGTTSPCVCDGCKAWERTDYSETSGSRETRTEGSTGSDSSDDSESWRDPVPVKEVTKGDSRVKDWSSQTEKPSDDDGSDPILEQYSLEPSPPVAFTLGRLEKAMGLRMERLQPILDAAKRPRSEKSSRASKRSRRS